MRTSSKLSALTALIALGCSQNTTPPSSPEPAPQSTSPAEPAPSGTPAPSKAGPAGAACGGLAGFGCAAGLYCAFALEAHCGAADQTGVCKAIPQTCTAQQGPVCGCNDKTYASECEAAREGVALSSAQACASTATPALAEGQTCGTRGVNAECGAGLYCKYRSNCGATDSGGTCARRPEMCTKIYKPVCGCDTKTYGNECEAAAAGTSVQSDGVCKGR